MINETVTIIKCETCGMSRDSRHPIRSCSRCQSDEYEAQVALLRRSARAAIPLGHDPYNGRLFFWLDGITIGIGAMLARCMSGEGRDALVRRITDLEAENKDVLAENARMRRALEGRKP